MADQLRYDLTGGAYMPNVAKLLGESVVFAGARCASPLCVPARGSFFTGKYPNVTGSIINGFIKEEECYAHVKAGTPNMLTELVGEWDVWHVGKRHFKTGDGFPEAVRFTHTDADYKAMMAESGKRLPGGAAYRGIVPEVAYGDITRTAVKNYSTAHTGCYPYGIEDYPDGFYAEGCLHAIDNRDTSKPLFLNAMFLAPHPPFDIPEPWYSLVKDVELPENTGVWSYGQSPLQMYNTPGVLGSHYSMDEWRESFRVYCGLTALLDDCIGRVIAKLKEAGIYDDTLIVFTSDHGEMLGAHCLFQKMCMYEEAVRTPLAFKFPSDYAPVCSTVGENVSAVDVFPTLMDYLNLPAPQGMSGISLMPYINGTAEVEDHAVPRDVFIQYDGNGSRGNFQRCVVSGDYKLIVDMFKDESFVELYNVRNDRLEMNNLALSNEYDEIATALIKKLSAHMQSTNDMLRLPENLFARFKENAKISHDFQYRGNS